MCAKFNSNNSIRIMIIIKYNKGVACAQLNWNRNSLKSRRRWNCIRTQPPPWRPFRCLKRKRLRKGVHRLLLKHISSHGSSVCSGQDLNRHNAALKMCKDLKLVDSVPPRYSPVTPKPVCKPFGICRWQRRMRRRQPSTVLCDGSWGSDTQGITWTSVL